MASTGMNCKFQRRNHEDGAISMNVRENDRLQQKLCFLEHTRRADLRRKELDQKLIFQKYGYLFKIPAHTDSYLRRSAIDKFRADDGRRQYSKETQIYSNLVSSNKSLFNSLHRINSLGSLDDSPSRHVTAKRSSLLGPEEQSSYSCHDTIWEKVLVGSAKQRHYAMLQKKRQDIMIENLKNKQEVLQQRQADYYKKLASLVPNGDTAARSKSKINSLADLLLLINYNISEGKATTSGQYQPGSERFANCKRPPKARWKKAVKTLKVESLKIDKSSLLNLFKNDDD